MGTVWYSHAWMHILAIVRQSCCVGSYTEESGVIEDVCEKVCECVTERAETEELCTACWRLKAWIRFISVCSAAFQNYGRNLRKRLTEQNPLAAPGRLVESNRADTQKKNTQTHTCWPKSTTLILFFFNRKICVKLWCKECTLMWVTEWVSECVCASFLDDVFHLVLITAVWLSNQEEDKTMQAWLLRVWHLLKSTDLPLSVTAVLNLEALYQITHLDKFVHTRMVCASAIFILCLWVKSDLKYEQVWEKGTISFKTK